MYVAAIRTMLDSFDGVISSALSSVNDLLSLFDTITGLTDVISNLSNTTIAGELTLGGLENYR